MPTKEIRKTFFSLSLCTNENWQTACVVPHALGYLWARADGKTFTFRDGGGVSANNARRHDLYIHICMHGGCTRRRLPPTRPLVPVHPWRGDTASGWQTTLVARSLACKFILIWLSNRAYKQAHFWINKKILSRTETRRQRAPAPLSGDKGQAVTGARILVNSFLHSGI